MKLLWRCDACHLPVENGQGWVHVPFADVSLAEVSAWDLASWRVHHSHCDIDITSSDYWIEVSRIRTDEAALDWTLHLSEKPWYSSTDWPTVVRQAISAGRLAA